MTTILIDTQVFVWLTNSDSRLGGKSLALLRDSSNVVAISYFSFFEIAIKSSIGKLEFDSSVIEDLDVMGIELIMPDKQSLTNYKIYADQNKDPFDNMIISVAKIENCALMTSDKKILSSPIKGISFLSALD